MPTLAERLACEGTPLNTRCGRRGLCRGCQVDVVAGEFELSGQHHIVAHGDAPVRVRACQVQEAGARLEVAIPATSRLDARGQIHDAFTLYDFDVASRLHVDEFTLDGTGTPLVEQLASRVSHEGRPPLGGLSPASLARLAQLAADDRIVHVVTWHDVVSTYFIHCGSSPIEPVAVAIDIGTTTVCAVLVDPKTGREVARANRYNAQVAEGDDVATRIGVGSTDEGLARLQRLVIDDTLNVLIDEVCAGAGIDVERVAVVAVAGNTVMTHLLLGLPVEAMGRVPFMPTDLSPTPVRLGALGVRGCRNGVCVMVPGISAYVGGDLVAGMHVSGLMARDGVQVLLDMGTNGEMILRSGDRVLCCATAAGPAFEGGGIECGIRAVAGAVQHVALCADGAVDLDLIAGEKRAVGLCGSAIVDFIAEASRIGIVSPMGRFDIDALRAMGRLSFVEKGQNRVAAFRLADKSNTSSGHELVVTERDIAEVLKAKAAIMAGVATLCEVAGLAVTDIDRFVLAGGFAHHLDLGNAIAMGLLPDLPRDRFEVIGNSSLAGAYLAIVDMDALASYRALARVPEVVELNRVESFEDHFVESLMIPHAAAIIEPPLPTLAQEASPPCASSC